jgi:MFS superfamily sulfate permease-like transporter
VLALAANEPRSRVVVLDLSLSSDLDVQSADMLDELAEQLARAGVELRLAALRAPALAVLRRAGVADRVHVAETIDDAVGAISRSG